ncbi:MAG: hypothetical protein BMS9Abin05_2127 [Rhodothermia bacterium]|nr:MAG: hypothetical protein BMS9Abin05_2127 [Rhodothermia bacterium]
METVIRGFQRLSFVFILVILAPAPSVYGQRTTDFEPYKNDEVFFTGLKEGGRCVKQIDLFNAQSEEIRKTSKKLAGATGDEHTRIKAELDRKAGERGKTYDAILDCASTAITAEPPEGTRLTGLEPKEIMLLQLAESLDKLIESSDSIIKIYDELIAQSQESQADLARMTQSRFKNSMKFVSEVASGDFFSRMLSGTSDSPR